MDDFLIALENFREASYKLAKAKAQCDKNNINYYGCYHEQHEVENASKMLEKSLNGLIDERVRALLSKVNIPIEE